MLEFLLSAIAIVLAILGIQSLVRFVRDSLNQRFRTRVVKLLKDNKKIKLAGISEKAAKEAVFDFEKEVANYEILWTARGKFGFISSIIGISEVIFFASLAALANDGVLLETLLASAGVWIGIKTFGGSYGQWSGVILGRNTFHIALIGQIANIILSVALGLFVRWAIIY